LRRNPFTFVTSLKMLVTRKFAYFRRMYYGAFIAFKDVQHDYIGSYLCGQTDRCAQRRRRAFGAIDRDQNPVKLTSYSWLACHEW
jgi:hypothetical protein